MGPNVELYTAAVMLDIYTGELDSVVLRPVCVVHRNFPSFSSVVMSATSRGLSKAQEACYASCHDIHVRFISLYYIIVLCSWPDLLVFCMLRTVNNRHRCMLTCIPPPHQPAMLW